MVQRKRDAAAHGPHGHRREAEYQRYCADLVREAIEERTLERAWQRIQHESAVRSDPVLLQMLQSYVEQKKVEIRNEAREAARRSREETAQFRVPAPRVQHTGTPGPAAGRAAAGGAAPSAGEEGAARPMSLPRPSTEQLRIAFARERDEFELALHRFDAAECTRILGRLEELIGRYGAAAFEPGQLEQCRQRLARLHERVGQFQAHVDRLEQHALAAAGRGETRVTGRLLQRLSSIHAARPALLSQERLQQFRERLADAGQEEEHRAAARALVERERAIAAELRQLMQQVHEFHLIVRQHPHDEQRFAAAEAKYRAALRQIKAHDSEWLAGVILELEDLIEELHDPTGRATEQLDRFLAAVRHALRETIREAQQIQQERQAGGSPPAGGSGGARPRG